MDPQCFSKSWFDAYFDSDKATVDCVVSSVVSIFLAEFNY
jgi:hypothetical protein